MIYSLIKKAVALLLSLIILFTMSISQSLERGESDKADQLQRIAQLEQGYISGEIEKVDEQTFFDGDLDSVLKSGIKFNEISFVATHNSYQTESVEAFRKIYKNLSTLTFGLVSDKTGSLDSQTLTEQFNCGIRSIELDIETVKDGDDISFTCLHAPLYDMTTNCYDLKTALKEIKMWSDYNPDHLPITIIIEPKKAFIPMENMKYMKLDYALALDELLRSVLGDTLFTPKDMLRDYSSFEEMRFADDWCQVKDILGKVMVLLHDTDVTRDYISVDESIKTQAMFPMLRYDDRDLPYASFLLINDPAEALKTGGEIIDEYKLIVRTMVDKITKISPENVEYVLEGKVQIVSTDYPVRSDLTAEDYRFSFGNNKTVRVTV